MAIELIKDLEEIFKLEHVSIGSDKDEAVSCSFIIGFCFICRGFNNQNPEEQAQKYLSLTDIEILDIRNEISQNQPDMYDNIGKKLIKQQKLGPKNSEIWVLLGNLINNPIYPKHDQKIAEKCYQQSIKHPTKTNEKTQAEAYTNLASISLQNNDTDKAMEQIEASIKYNCEYASSYSLKGVLYCRDDYPKKSCIEAINNFTIAIDKDPIEHKYFLKRAKVYLGWYGLEAQNFDKAFQDLNLVIFMEPANYEAYCLKGSLLASEQYSKKNLRAAVENFDLAIQKNNGKYAEAIHGKVNVLADPTYEGYDQDEANRLYKIAAD